MTRFNHFNFNVLDLERSLAFYKQALNLTPAREKVAADGSYKLVFLQDEAGSPFQLELTWLPERKSPMIWGRGSITWPSRRRTSRRCTSAIRPWAASALRTPPWASTSSRIRTGTGSRSSRCASEQEREDAE